MSRLNDPSRPDLYTRVTNAIVADLEKGVRPWTKPWSAEHLAGRISRPLRSTGEPYSGINVLLLWAESVARGYAAPIWITFRQALALGGHVRKGEHGVKVVTWINRVQPSRVPGEPDKVIRRPWTTTVFHVSQTEPNDTAAA